MMECHTAAVVTSYLAAVDSEDDEGYSYSQDNGLSTRDAPVTNHALNSSFICKCLSEVNKTFLRLLLVLH